MSTSQKQTGQTLGMLAGGAIPSQSTLALNAAGTWIAFSFVPNAARTINAVRAFLSAVAGTMVAGDLTCEVQTETGTGAPSGSIVTNGGPVNCGATPTSGWNGWSGLTASLNAQTPYWLVFKNINATQASNFPTFRWVTGAGVQLGQGPKANFSGYATLRSANSGSSWTNGANAMGPRLAYADGSYDGVPVSAVSNSTGIYSTNEVGIKFALPAGPKYKVAGLFLSAALPNGTPTGTYSLNLWTGATSTPTLLATCGAIPNAYALSNGWLLSYFSASQTIDASGGAVTVRITAKNSAADSSSNCFRLNELTVDSDASSLAQMPFGSCVKTVTTDGVNFTDTTTAVYGGGLMLDTDGEFAAATGGVSGARIFSGF